MPTYEYECTQCHERLEHVAHFSDPPLTTCPQCGGPLKKVFSVSGISFRGPGFYRTDSASSK
jgi:putative FmdB family regulatory protein